MVCSMTGYGRGEVADEKHKFTVEMKSVNNRYLDINIKMPKKFNALESKIRNELKQFVKRGKVDVFITYEDFSETDTRVRYNKEIAAEYLGYLKQMSDDFGIDNDIRVSTLSKYPDVFSMEDAELDEEEMWGSLKKVIDKAGEEFLAARQKEGEFLHKDLDEKLEGMLESVDFITERSPIIIDEYKEKLRVRSYSEPKSDDLVFVELKKKLDGIVYKRRTKAYAGEVLSDIYECRFSDPQVGKEIRYALQYYDKLRPAVYIGCNRTSYVANDDRNLRITFDKDIRYRMRKLSLNACEEYDKPVTDKIVMELKVKNAMPLWLTQILDEVKAYPRGFSKVGTAFLKELRGE